MAVFQTGDRVELTLLKSIKHFRAADMSITGYVVAVDPDNKVGTHKRPYLVRFNEDGRLGWYAANEIRRV